MAFNFFGRKRVKVQASELAGTLFYETISSPNMPTGHLIVPPELKEAFEGRAFIYKVATLFKAARVKEKTESKFKLLTEALDNILVEQSAKGSSLAVFVAEAEIDLDNLMNENKPLTWSMKWLAKIGIQETNPATLSLFGMFWPVFMKAHLETFDTIEPIKDNPKI